jgi:hypothetical protein
MAQELRAGRLKQRRPAATARKTHPIGPLEAPGPSIQDKSISNQRLRNLGNYARQEQLDPSESQRIWIFSQLLRERWYLCIRRSVLAVGQ